MSKLIYSNNLRALRTTYSISQDRLAADLHIDRKTISRIERGENCPSLELAYLISVYFEKKIPYVFPLADNMTFATYKKAKATKKRSRSHGLSNHRG